MWRKEHYINVHSLIDSDNKLHAEVLCNQITQLDTSCQRFLIEDVVLIEKVGKNKEILEKVEERLEKVGERLKKIEERLEKVGERLEKIEERLEKVEERLKNVGERLENVEKELIKMRKDLQINFWLILILLLAILIK